MSKAHSASKHLYTLNDSKLSDSDPPSLDSSLSDDTPAHPANSPDRHRDMQRLARKNEQLLRSVGELQLRNQELVELAQLAEKRNQKHEEKQRDLIRKLSYFQVSNQQLAYDLRKASQDLGDTRENRKLSENQVNEVKQTIKKSLYEKEKFLAFLRSLLDLLRKCERPEEFAAERDRVLQFIQRNIAASENNQKITCEFDLKFELSRVDTLKEKVRTLEQEAEDSKAALDRERAEKKKLVATYNDKIARLRELHDGLREKVELQEEESRRKMKGLLAEKNEMIEALRGRLRESRTAKNTADVKKSRESKKSYIGDGDLSHLELNELNDAIEHLEMQIIKEFEE